MTEHTQRGFLARLWFGFWDGIDWFRRVVLNLLFLLLVVIILSVWLGGDNIEPLKSGTTLLVQPQGNVVEQYSGTPLERALDELTSNSQPETRLRDLLRALELARTDPQITQVLIDVRQLWSIGMASLQELQTALVEFKTSGKPVYAIGAFMDQYQYYLASLADEVWLERDGLVWLDGFAVYRNYYREGLDKLAVDINLFRVGEYKSAAEPYIRNDMSPQDREANLYLLDGLWQQYLETIAQNRGLPVDVLERSISNYAEQIQQQQGDAAQVALAMSLVDGIKSRPELRAELIQSGTSDGSDSFRQIHFQAYVQRHAGQQSGRSKIGIVVVEGEIISGSGPPGTAGSANVSALLRQAATDKDIKAVVLRIDSPGGDAFASEVIRQELLNLQESGKPVLVSMGDLAASGGYWIAMGADEIWTNPATITGSIGIFGVLPTFQESLAKLGIYTDGVGTTEVAGGLRLDRELSAPVRQIIQALVEAGYSDFLSLVAEQRDMSTAQVDQLARGRVWSGQQALDRSLVDQQGSLQAVIAAAAIRADLGDDYQVQWVEPALTVWESLIIGWSARLLSSLDIDPDKLIPPGHLRLPRQLEARLRQQLEPLLRQYERPGILAHCLCVTPR